MEEIQISGDSFWNGPSTGTEKPRVLIVETTPFQPHLQTSFEIALRAASDGWEVSYVFFKDADSRFAFQHSSFTRRLANTWLLRWLRDEMAHIRLLRLFCKKIQSSSLPLTVDVLGRRSWWSGYPLTSSLGTQEQLTNWKMDGHPAGIYMASSLISLTKNVDFDPRDYQRLIRELAGIFQGLMVSGREIIERYKPDRLVIFNGRFNECGPFKCLAEELGVELYFHERGGLDVDGFFLANWQPHDLARHGRAALEAWECLDEKDKSIARYYVFESMQKASEQSGFAFPPIRRPDRADILPSGYRGPLVTFFTSTEGEFESLHLLTPKSGFDTQWDAIISLAAACDEIDATLAIRVHPNVAKSSPEERRKWDEELEHAIPGCLIYGSRDKIDSYALIDQSDVVAVWQSTIGLEAVGRGRATLTFCETPYEWAGTDIRRVNSAATLVEDLTEALDCVPDPESVFPFVHYFLRNGHAFQHIDFNEWSFRATRPKLSSWYKTFERKSRKFKSRMSRAFRGATSRVLG